jgi:uncharacterized repeat protein (TIGR01451 family)
LKFTLIQPTKVTKLFFSRLPCDQFFIWLGCWLCLILPAAQAQSNLVTNPFFSGAAPAGWVTAGTAAASSYTNFGAVLRGTPPTQFAAAGGTTAYDSGCVGTALACLSYNTATFAFNAGAGGAKQTITTVVGEAYYLVFWTYFSGAATGANIQTDAYWGSNRVFSTNPAATGWTQQVVNLGVASSASYVLAFLMRDDPAFSQTTFVQVYAYPSVKVTKTAPAVVTITQAYTYTVTLSNASAGLTSTGVTLADTISAGASIGSVNCSATSTAPWAGSCPAGGFPFAAFNLSPSTTLTFTFTGTVNASTTGTVTNNASATSTLRSTLTSILSATATSAIIAPANLSLSKTNSVSSVVAGGTTQYQITASNAGPAYANQALIKDTPSAGLSCTSLTCSSTGGATCPGALSVTGLTGAGLNIPIFPPSSTVTFLLTCNVTATGG